MPEKSDFLTEITIFFHLSAQCNERLLSLAQCGPSPSRSISGGRPTTSESGTSGIRNRWDKQTGHFVNTMKPECPPEKSGEIPPDSTVENSKKTSADQENHIEKVIQRSMEKVFDRKIKTLEKNMDARFDILQKVIKISYQNLPKK